MYQCTILFGFYNFRLFYALQCIQHIIFSLQIGLHKYQGRETA